MSDHITEMRHRAADSANVASFRRGKASDQFKEAAALAAANGFLLSRHTEFHYSIRRSSMPRWLTNIYPGKKRILSDMKKPERGPYVKLPPEWDLLDLVNGFIEAHGEWK